MLSVKKLLKTLSVTLLATTLVGCDVYVPSINYDFKEIKPMVWDFKNEKGELVDMTMNTNKLYVACINRQAFVIETISSSSNIVPVKDGETYIYCDSKHLANNLVLLVRNESSRLLDDNKSFELCLGGYTFYFIKNLYGKSTIIQAFNENGSSKFCMPRDLSVLTSDFPFLHPELKIKSKAIENILKSGINNATVSKEKIF